MKEGKLVSIIIPTYNRPKAVVDCIRNIKKQTYKNIEIIVVDDASNVPYELPSTSAIRYFRMKGNSGPAASRNFGIRRARGELLLFVDDDIQLRQDYIEILLKGLTTFKNLHVGAVAGRLLYPQKPNLGIESGPLVSISKWTGDPKLRASVDTKHPVFTKVLHSCALIPKDVFRDIGPWDAKRYKGNYTYVEPDLCYRMRARGWGLVFEPRAVAEHLQLSEGGARGMPRTLYRWYTMRNALLFLIRFYGWRAIYMWPAFVLSRLFGDLR